MWDVAQTASRSPGAEPILLATHDPSTSTIGPLAARQLACRRGRRTLFRGLDLSLQAGQVVWLRGTNGSGKTSLMRILAGLSHPAEGDVMWGEQTLRAAGSAARQQLVYIGHANALKDDLTLSEALAFLGGLAGQTGGHRSAEAALARMGLASRADAPVRTLSQGQRRRGALARLVLDDAPRTWVLDEPFDALDVQSVAKLAALIEANAQRGGSVLLTSHQAVQINGSTEFDLEPWRVAP